MERKGVTMKVESGGIVGTVYRPLKIKNGSKIAIGKKRAITSTLTDFKKQ